MTSNSKPQDYRRYRWTGRDILLEAVKVSAFTAMLAYFFYRSVWAVIPLIPVGLLFLKMDTAAKKKKQAEQLNEQFKECILSVSAALRAGYAVENAFVESRNDMKMLYGEHSAIYRELEGIRRGLIINITLEELIADLADRSGSEDIRQFAQVFSIAKRGGGNLQDILSETALMIGRRVDAKREIHTVLSGRKMEQNIMKIMPFGILFYIGSSYKGYFQALYHNWLGVLVMTGCLAVYMAAFVLGDRILGKIETEIG